jgi:hypothetical protein
MTAHALWQRYSAIWSEPDADRRTSELAACLADNASYCDPNGLIEGHAALSSYMAGFQQTVPGGTFRLNSLKQHNDRTLANWSMLGPDGQTMQEGVSFAQLSADGRLTAISGFFDLPAED